MPARNGRRATAAGRATPQMLALCLATLCAACAAAAPGSGATRHASAVTTGSLAWSAPFRVLTGSVSVTCNRRALCLAVGEHLLSISTTPVNPASWTEPVSAFRSLPSVACPSVQVCFGVSNRSVLSLSRPTQHRRPWTKSAPLVSASIPGSPDANYLAAISCPSLRLCVVGDFRGEILTSTHPASRKSSWSAPIPLGPNQDVDGLACPTVHVCVATTGAGLIFTSTHPTGGPGAWKRQRSYPNGLSGIACATGRLCVAFDSLGNIIVSHNPTGGSRAWSTPIRIDDGAELDAISCPSTTLCVAVDMVGFATELNPAGHRPTWTSPEVIDPGPDPEHQNVRITTVSCPMVRLCVAGDENGNVVVGRPG
jgi:hypothetical protein